MTSAPDSPEGASDDPVTNCVETKLCRASRVLTSPKDEIDCKFDQIACRSGNSWIVGVCQPGVGAREVYAVSWEMLI